MVCLPLPMHVQVFVSFAHHVPGHEQNDLSFFTKAKKLYGFDAVHLDTLSSPHIFNADLLVDQCTDRYPLSKCCYSSAKCLEYVKEHAERGNPASVIACIDEFASTNHMMNIGPVKGAVIDEEIRKKKPAVVVELGAYTGYSTVRFASLQREVAGTSSHYYSFEYSPVFAARVREMVDLAGLSNHVTVYVGAFSEQYQVLQGKQVDVSVMSGAVVVRGF
ncbi:unnamed protein product [Phytophthora lilii]|uniref:catechol O-methyltransferase n=1 Tax=Phytophthora lilii TaxID=2077276 RepID=A0A9W6WRY9_9STRA|nr:unnamed protein product [Phytophthora lilii]